MASADVVPSADERDAANLLRRVVAPEAGQPRRLTVTNDAGGRAEIVLTPGLSRALTDLLRHLGDGEMVTVVPTKRMLTTQGAADILDVSRPFLITLLERGDLPHVLVGQHRRIRAEDVFAYKRRRKAERDAALAELIEMDADLI